MIVRDGLIRGYTITSGGEERVVALYGRGDIFPLTWVLGETTNTLFYYDALTDVRLMTVDKEDFITAISGSTETLGAMLRFVGNHYTAQMMRITGLEQSYAIEKIGYTLYYLLFRYGVEKRPGVFTIKIKLTQNTIASMVGLTRESSTKNLGILKDKGIIRYHRSMYTVNKAKLEKFLDEDSFQNTDIYT